MNTHCKQRLLALAPGQHSCWATSPVPSAELGYLHVPLAGGQAPAHSVWAGEPQTSSRRRPVSDGRSCRAWMWVTPQRSSGAAQAPSHEPPLALLALCVSSLPLQAPSARCHHALTSLRAYTYLAPCREVDEAPC